MHRRRQSSPGQTRSVREVFCSVSSVARSPSPTKQDLYELLQRHRMHSFTRRMKNYMQDENASPEAEIPSYMRQTCSSLIKRSNSKSRSLTMSPSRSSRESWGSGNVLSGRKQKLYRKTRTSGCSDAFTVDEGPPRKAMSTTSKMDPLCSASTDFAYMSSNYDDIYEADHTLRNEHALFSKDTIDEVLFMTPVQELFDKDERQTMRGIKTRDSSLLLSDGGSPSSVNVEYGTSDNIIKFYEDRGSFEDAFLTNSQVSELLDTQSNEQATSELLAQEKRAQRISLARNNVRKGVHNEALLSSRPDEQCFLSGNGSTEFPESTRLDYTRSTKSSSSSSLYLHNMFCDTDESNEPFMRSSITHDLQQSSSAFQLSTNEFQPAVLNQVNNGEAVDGSVLDNIVDSTRQGSFKRRSSRGNGRSSTYKDAEVTSAGQRGLRNHNGSWTGDSTREDIVHVENGGCLESSNSLATEETSDFNYTSARILGSVSSLCPTSLCQTQHKEFNAELLEAEVRKMEQLETNDQNSNLSQFNKEATLAKHETFKQQQKHFNDSGRGHLVIEEKLENSEKVVMNGQELVGLSCDDDPLTTTQAAVSKAAPGISSIVLKSVTLSNSSDSSISDTESLFFVQSTNPRSLPELFSIERPPTADDIALFSQSPRSEAQFIDDHSSLLVVQTNPASFFSGENLYTEFDTKQNTNAQFWKVKRNPPTKLFGKSIDNSNLSAVPRDYLKEVEEERLDESNGPAMENNSANCSSLPRQFRDTSANRGGGDSGKAESAEYCADDSASAEADFSDHIINYKNAVFASVNHTPERETTQFHSSLSEKEEKKRKTVFQKFVHVLANRKEKKKNKTHRSFHFSVKSCFGCGVSSPVLHESDSMVVEGKTKDRKWRKSKK
eukprot:g8183.t1